MQPFDVTVTKRIRRRKLGLQPADRLGQALRRFQIAIVKWHVPDRAGIDPDRIKVQFCGCAQQATVE